MTRQINEAGLALIKQFEGCRLEAYLDSAGIPTIGWGDTAGVKLGDTCTQERADRRLEANLSTAEEAVVRLVTVPLSNNQFDALCSFCFNLGASSLHTSTLLFDLNHGNYQAAANEFLRWVYAGGHFVEGLLRRREAERDLFLTADT